MADETHDTIDRSETPAVTASATLPVLALLLGVVGTGVMVFSFSNGIPAALDGGGSGADPFLVAFGAGGAMAVAAVVLGIVGLRRRGHPILSVLAILAGLLPGLMLLFIFALNSMTICCAQPPTP